MQMRMPMSMIICLVTSRECRKETLARQMKIGKTSRCVDVLMTEEEKGHSSGGHRGYMYLSQCYIDIRLRQRQTRKELLRFCYSGHSEKTYCMSMPPKTKCHVVVPAWKAQQR